jgi:hypothetical protein
MAWAAEVIGIDLGSSPISFTLDLVKKQVGFDMVPTNIGLTQCSSLAIIRLLARA